VQAAGILARLHSTAVLPEVPSLFTETFRNPFAPLILRAVREAEASPHSGTDIQRELKSLLVGTRADIYRLLERMERFTAELGRLDIDFVTTHGDSGFGNFLIDDAGAVHLVDWDSLGFGPPERDLSKVPSRRFDDVLTAYFDAGGPRTLHPEIFEFYDYWWAPEAIAYAAATILFESHTPEENADALQDLHQYLPMRWHDFEGAPSRTAILRAHGFV
jgi:thiamine kinase-like enzyme